MENHVEPTKRALSHSLELPKRVALGELTNAELNRNNPYFHDVQNQKPKLSSKRKFKEDVENSPGTESTRELESGNQACKRKWNEKKENEVSIAQESSERSKRKCKEDVENSPGTESTRESESGNQACKRKWNEKKENEVSIAQESSESSCVLQKCSFSSSIYEHLRSLEMEIKRRPLPKYMEDVQNDFSVNMREMLVDWLVGIAEECNLVSETLYLTIAYVDRFLSSHALNRNKLKLLGVACMLIASKYEEISSPHVENFCHMTDNTYRNEEVVSMETEVLKFLNFEMSTPTSKNFLRLFIKATQENCRVPNLRFEFLCCYLAELSLLDYGCVRYLPSVVAASAIFLSRFMIQPDKQPWSMALQSFSGYKPSELKDCVLAIQDLHMNRTQSSLQAIRYKYKQHKFKQVATLSSPFEVPARYFEAINE